MNKIRVESFVCLNKKFTMMMVEKETWRDTKKENQEH